jgi:hypothetical protein
MFISMHSRPRRTFTANMIISQSIHRPISRVPDPVCYLQSARGNTINSLNPTQQRENEILYEVNFPWLCSLPRGIPQPRTPPILHPGLYVCCGGHDAILVLATSSFPLPSRLTPVNNAERVAIMVPPYRLVGDSCLPA